ncbi:unnamed protein product [Cunninghamella echinulata]
MENTSINAQYIYQKRLKFYHKTAQVYRVFHGIYSPDAKAIDGISSLNPPSSLSSFVQAYTSLLYEYINDIKYDTDSKANSERELFLNIASLWHLFQILFFSNNQKEISINLMNWLNQLDKRSILKFDIQGIFNYSIPSNHSLFWPLVYKLILRGELDVLIQLLHITSQQINNDDEKSILKILISSLQSYQQSIPTNTNVQYITNNKNNNNNDYSMNEKNKWHSSTKQIQTKIKSLKTTTSSTLATHAISLLNIMTGDLKEIYQHSTSLVEAIVASIYYDNNTIYSQMNKSHDDNDNDNETIRNTFKHIQTISQQLKNYGIKNKNELDQHIGLITLLQGNIYATLEQCSALDWWLLAHMTDILDRYSLQNNQLDNIFNNQPLYIHMGDEHQLAEIETRDYFILTYANFLVVQKDLWRIAFDYMSTCGMTGRNQINKAIENVPLINDDVSKELADYCTQHGLIQRRQQIYKKMASQYLNQGLYDKAIHYYCLLGNFSDIDFIFESLLRKYVKTRELNYLEDLEPSYKNLCNGTMATFYFDYCRIHTLTEKENFYQALQLMNQLIISSETPLSILPMLFMESIVLLRENTVPLPKNIIDSLKDRLFNAVTIKNSQGIEFLGQYLGKEKKKIKI